MPKKRARIFEVKWFSLVIAALVFVLFFGLAQSTRIVDQLEGSVLDVHFRIKQNKEGKSVQEGATFVERNLKLSESILLIGIDQKTLAEYGKWPFVRTRHANLINAFSRLNDQSNRESALFLDVFFIEPDTTATNDAVLVDSIESSGKVYLETVLDPMGETLEGDEYAVRQKSLYDTHGTITNVTGDWKKIIDRYSIQPPLEPYARASGGYGHANFVSDVDKIYRRQPLVLRQSMLVRKLRLDELTPGFSVNEDNFERLAWLDARGFIHDIDSPITAAELKKLAARMAAEAPMQIEDVNMDGVPDDSYYVIRHYRDYFVPSITLSLALEYFHKDFDDLEVVAGSHILIPNPMMRVGDDLVPYTIQTGMDIFDADNNLVEEGKRRVVPEIRIPIDEQGQMLINFMGPRSAETPDLGPQTFPVRSYSAYANRDPGPDPSTWKRTLAVKDKILMVGAFASGMAEDEKPTPLGMMYGIEMHANALNTILMDNFIIKAPYWLDLLVIALAALLVAALSARIPAIGGFFATLAMIGIYFFAVDLAFDRSSYLLGYAAPAFAAIVTFILVVVYRVFTEERDKKQIRETFGKYLSPKVVDQLANDPPELGGVDKELTVFFSDIRGFTTLSENMTPQELVNHLNEYLTAMTDIALDYGATLDKYMGDAIMCFWGAPIPQAAHAELACKCALRQMQALDRLNASWPEAKRINIGIGLNSGIMTVGNMGSKLRMNYTLMGDHVNLGSRLEATNKEYGTNIIISENTYALVKDKFIVRELDNIRVKGKNKPVVIYELVDCTESIDPPVQILKG